ncbi:hypothetical protein M3221_12720 [Domibacillus indicus]|uniref:hypothetical protein n=1 Tax=Domibacillus indicus TaxID=1437523 RepID=UPI002041D9CE|nr:hypothetical protein [Domibacillus indicus]MCM3789265.1 hypothetical protein [Domibacillus indicus]
MTTYHEMKVESNFQEDGQYDVQVKIKSKEIEELDILLSGIKALIDIIDVMCENDKQKYQETMKKIIYEVADDIGFTTGAYIEKLGAAIQYNKKNEPFVEDAVKKVLITKFLNDSIENEIG